MSTLALPANPTAPIAVRHIVAVSVGWDATKRTEHLNAYGVDKAEARMSARAEAYLLFPGERIGDSAEEPIRIGD